MKRMGKGPHCHFASSFKRKRQCHINIQRNNDEKSKTYRYWSALRSLKFVEMAPTNPKEDRFLPKIINSE
jgi:hypothetical protein